MSLTLKTKKWLFKNSILSLKGKTAVITGANSGIGYKTAEILAYLGANIILACRNEEKANNAADKLSSEYPNVKFSVLKLNLADFSSILKFTEKIRDERIDIDIFVNNAGVFHKPGEKTEDGFEIVMGTNYLGVYYLTESLIKYLSSLPHKVAYINTISIAYKVAKQDYNDFYCAEKYRNFKVYAHSKLCLARYSYYIAQKYKGTNIEVYICHPGIAITPLGINSVPPYLRKPALLSAGLFNSVEKSALSPALILTNRFPSGSIVGPDKLFGGWGYPKLNRTYKKVKTGGEQLVRFTEKEIESIKRKKENVSIDLKC